MIYFSALFLSASSFALIPQPEVKLTYIFENHFNYSGGVRQTNVVNGLALLELYTPETTFFPSIGATQLYMSLMGYHGKSPADQVGDLQLTSNIDTNGNEGIKLFEIFFDQHLFSENFRLRAGLLVLGLVYNINEPALLFSHSTPGTTAEWALAGPYGAPVYPWPTFAMDLQFDAVDGHYVYAVVGNEYNGNTRDERLEQENIVVTSDDHLRLIEMGRNFEDAKVALGYWEYSRDFSPGGWYMIADKKFGKTFHPFIRYGQMLNDSTAIIKASMTTGLTFAQPFGLRRDVWGVMVASAYLSDSFIRESNKRQNHETAWEAVYRHHFSPMLDGLISYMYVDGPAGGAQLEDPNTRITDANIILLRLIFTL
jgi:carbohydrate-selective porin OprB